MISDVHLALTLINSARKLKLTSLSIMVLFILDQLYKEFVYDLCEQSYISFSYDIQRKFVYSNQYCLGL